VTLEEKILGAVLSYPEFYGDIKDALNEEDFSDGLYRRLFAAFKSMIEAEPSNFEISLLNQDFSADEIGKLTRIMMSEAVSRSLNRPDKIKNSADLLRQRNSRRNHDGGRQDTDEWYINYINSKRNQIQG
jgi:replicative DNA helicase